MTRPGWADKMECMIVKVQLSQFSSDGKRMVLIYNKDRSIRKEREADVDFLILMNDEPKKYFEATEIDGVLTFQKEVEPQNW
jgi:hypothetical protein